MSHGGPGHALKNATAAAAANDVTVLCLGIDKTIEHEGSDREQIGLPPPQHDLLEAVVSAVSAAGKTLVVVLVNGGPLSSDYLKNATAAGKVHAIIEAFELGSWSGQAVAEVLYGDVNPSGYESSFLCIQMCTVYYTLLPPGYYFVYF